MKFLRLVTAAVCGALLTIATVSAQCDENVSKQLRGIEENYDDVDLFPSPEDNGDNTELDGIDDEGVLPPGAGDEDENEPGEEQLIPAESEESDGESPPDAINQDELDVAEETDDEVIDVEDVAEIDIHDQETFYVRRLRSSFDPALHGQIQVDEPVPITEVVTPPSAGAHSNPSFRGLDMKN
ncbi:Hypothetical protein PHPALM_37178 [Phytophthora palmivora]|uniref:Secreted protein n=1 Tax=Phytophthora palmivora TaxID=4796 RepID=A0A2P4WY41_9STRA|nr:Hypothetical protein PHPALM_37178 [Phytophthora palmivora]